MPARLRTRPAPAAAAAGRAARLETGADTRRRLLDAAGELFAAHGFRGATLREIADRARANLAAANYHFGSKEALYLEVARERFDALERRLAAGGAAGVAEADLAARSRDELVALLRARLRTMLASLLEDDPIHAALMQRELLDPSAALPVIVRRWVAPMRAAMQRILARLEPGLGPAELERCTFSAIGQVAFFLTHRPALLLMLERRAFPPGFVDEIADHVTEFTLGGIERAARRRPARPAPASRRRSRP